MSSSAPSTDIDHYATIETYLKYMADNPDPALVSVEDPNGNDVTAVNGNLTTENPEDDKQDKEDNKDKTEEKPDDTKEKTEERPKHNKEKTEEKPIIKTTDGKFRGEEECQKELEQWAREAQKWGDEHGFKYKDRQSYEEDQRKRKEERRRRKQYGRPLE